MRNKLHGHNDDDDDKDYCLHMHAKNQDRSLSTNLCGTA